MPGRRGAARPPRLKSPGSAYAPARSPKRQHLPCFMCSGRVQRGFDPSCREGSRRGRGRSVVVRPHRCGPQVQNHGGRSASNVAGGGACTNL